MFINFSALDKAPDMIPVVDIGKIISRSRPAANNFLNKSGIKRIKKGRENFILKQDLLLYLNKNHWLPSVSYYFPSLGWVERKNT